MWKTVLFIILTLVLAPILAYFLDTSPSSEHQRVIQLLATVCLMSAIVCFIVSTITKNYSQVDKLWSIMPIVYTWIATWQGGYDSRMVLMAFLVTIWGIRLTYNFHRRGGYKLKFWEGEEDYRWSILRQKKEFESPIKWTIFNLLFISIYQMGLILLFTLPIVKCMDGKPICIWDILLASLFIGFVILETIADHQQWIFQNDKNKNPNQSKGFLSTGLWRIVRHPNYAAEQALWIVFYLFSVAATGIWVNWSIMGCILLILLFKGSSDFSENISVGKYPEYQEYQKSTPRFIPFIK